jgi:hypothetical protein
MHRLELAGIRRSVLVVLGIAILIPVAVAVWALTQVGGSATKPAAASVQASHPVVHHSVVDYRGSPLFRALMAANSSDLAAGLLPPSSCKAMSASMVTCTQPHTAVDGVIFRTFPSLKALYSAYEARVAALSGAPFRANHGNCTELLTNGEIGWNHNYQHPSYYPLSMFTSGRITDDQAAGRMFCTMINGFLHLVWTQDDGRVLGELAGAPHLDAYRWWHNVHHEIVVPGAANPMQGMPGMQTTTSAQTTTGMQTMTTSHTATGTQTSQSMSGMGK